MSYDLLLDDKHDLALPVIFTDDARRVRQQIEVTLLTVLSDWFLDVTWGIPLFDKILVKSPRRAEIETIIRAKVLDVPGVAQVPTVDVQINNETRHARINLPGIVTDHGLMDVSIDG